MKNIMIAKNRDDFRLLLKNSCKSEKECWLLLKRGKPKNNNEFAYLDAVEEALCFG